MLDVERDSVVRELEAVTMMPYIESCSSPSNVIVVYVSTVYSWE